MPNFKKRFILLHETYTAIQTNLFILLLLKISMNFFKSNFFIDLIKVNGNMAKVLNDFACRQKFLANFLKVNAAQL